MLGRKLLLVLGTAALLGGLGLSLSSLLHPVRVVERPGPVVEQQMVLVVTRPIPARALLRADDLAWKAVAATALPVGSYARGQVAVTDLVGAVARRQLRPGDIVSAREIVRPNEPGFLPTVLRPGTRAISIAVGPAEGTSGLIVPGDHVDVVLTQSFSDSSVPLSRRSVGETVLRDLRVIAIDQTVAVKAKGEGRSPEAQVAKTVTLEVSVPQGETLMVALQLGKVQLMLRNADDADNSPDDDALPVWGYDVSPALRTLDAQSPPVAGPRDSAKGTSVEILRGGRVELRCFDESGRNGVDCPGALPAPATAPAPIPPAPAPAPATPRTQ